MWEFLEFLVEVPPDYLILAAVHGLGAKPAEMTENDVQGLQTLMGPAQPMPDDVREAIAWMESFGSSPPRPN